MVTRRKVKDHWTETKRVVRGEVVSVTCCCAAPGESRCDCATRAGNKTPCPCHCHTVRRWQELEKQNEQPPKESETQDD